MTTCPESGGSSLLHRIHTTPYTRYTVENRTWTLRFHSASAQKSLHVNAEERCSGFLTVQPRTEATVTNHSPVLRVTGTSACLAVALANRSALRALCHGDQRAGAEQPALRGGVATLSCCRWGSARVRAGRTVRLSQVILPHLLMSLQLPL
ncbi:hypothetical protein AOLI_G00181300 [Acnodon oligacanthus]